VTETRNEGYETQISEKMRENAFRKENVKTRRAQWDMGKPRAISSTAFTVKWVIGYFPNLFVFLKHSANTIMGVNGDYLH
jgi:hypothetical protein